MHSKYFCLAPFQVLGKYKPYTILLLHLFVGSTGVRGLKRSNRYAYILGGCQEPYALILWEAHLTLNLQLTVDMTRFQHKENPTMVWTSPNGRLNKIKYSVHHILINRKLETLLQDVGVKRRLDINSDHYLVSWKIKFKVRHL